MWRRRDWCDHFPAKEILMGEMQDNLRKAEADTLAMLESFIVRVTEKIRRDTVLIIEQNDAIASGALRKGIVTDVLKEVGRIIGVVGVAADVPYGIYRHEGTRPHFPPIEPLQKWVRKKGLAGSYSKATKRRLGSRSIQDAQDYALAFAIARKIARRGTVGLRFLEMAFDQNMGWIQNELQTVKL
jgi:hypothetical protein